MTKMKHKRKANKPNIPKTRKQLRKEQRKLKKQRRHEYYTNRNKPGKNVTSPKSEASSDEVPQKLSNSKSKPPNPKVMSFEDRTNKLVEKEKREQVRLRKEMQKQRNKQLVQANIEEDRNIKQLEKQLKLNKRKSKSVPKSFASEGLGYLLEVCDSENMKSIIASEEQLKEVNEEFEEDFALMSGKRLENKRNSLKKDGHDYDDKQDDSDDNEGKQGDSDEKGDDFSDDDNDNLSDFGDSLGDNDERLSEADVSQSDDPETSNDGALNSEQNEVAEAGKRQKGGKDKTRVSKQIVKEYKPKGTDKNIKVLETESNNKRKEIDDNILKPNKRIKHINSSNSQDDDNELISEGSDNESNNDDKFSEDSSVSDDDAVNAKEGGTWEDIYGRLRAKDGSILTKKDDRYVPPAIRAKMQNEFSEDKQRTEKLNRLKKQLKGLLNRLAEANMHSISTQIEKLYMNNSRNDMNYTIVNLMLEALGSNTLTPERLLLEHVMLITILHANIGTEIGAHFLQMLVKKFDELFTADQDVENKMLDNVINMIAHLYSFKVFHSQLLYQILTKLSDKFDEKSVECILLVLKNVGFSLRKDDPLTLKSLILSLHKHATDAPEELKENSRVKYMLDILLAIKNNNMSKIPNYDISYSEHLKKLLKSFVRRGNYVTQLNISLDDLLKADERGKWWVVGSAWSGNISEGPQNANAAIENKEYSQKLLDLARTQRMNTDIRRNIFCIIMSAEDYVDAFEKLLHLGLKNQQEREIIHVILHCCLQEKAFNPYYAVLAQKLCDYDRKYQMTIKYSVWDKLKSLTECSANQISNLAKLLTRLFVEKGLPISTLKIVQFGELDKVTLRFIRQILLGILLSEDAEMCLGVFEKLGQSDKLKMFRESLRLFVHHFLLRNLAANAVPEDQKELLRSRADMVEKVLTVSDKKMKF